jgi:UDP-N-acetylmuramoyl-tripeptide--D-alanyl-D-alanine ligase
MMDTAAAARAVSGRIVGDSVRFARVTTDSRALQAGDLFVALSGERFDGHDFVAAAFVRGAAAALVAAARADGIKGNLVVAADPQAALCALATHWRRQFTIPVIVIVGSNGKTTVKEMLASILRAHFGEGAVLATQGNLNNAIGLPLTLLRLRAAHRVAAIELGMNHRGETAALAAIAQPTIALVNNAQREHQEFMRTVAEVAAEHADLVRALPEHGIAVLNADDAHVDAWRGAARERRDVGIIEFGLERPAAVRGRHAPRPDGSGLEIATATGDINVVLAARGRHNACNALAAATAALAVGVPLAAVALGLQSFRPVAGRLAALRATNGAAIIDDTYNANPDSVRAAIDVLAAAPAPRWLVLGDMGEVGANGPKFHREVGAYARSAHIERLLTAGTLAAEAAAAFGDGGTHFDSVEALARDVARTAPADSTLLVKGSRFMRMERVVDALAGDAPPPKHASQASSQGGGRPRGGPSDGNGPPPEHAPHASPQGGGRPRGEPSDGEGTN